MCFLNQKTVSAPAARTTVFWVCNTEMGLEGDTPGQISASLLTRNGLRSHSGHVRRPTHGEDERIQSSQLSHGPGDLIICTLQVSKGSSERLAHLHTWGLMEAGC